MLVRVERPADVAAIRGVIVDAFGGASEADLVDRLRAGGHLLLSLVAEESGEICAHAALSRLRSPARAAALAPVAVSAARQRQGIGSALVRAAIAEGCPLAIAAMFVVGDPAFYGRFGFAAGTAARYPCRYAGPHFMALALAAAMPETAEVVYAPPFDLLA